MTQSKLRLLLVALLAYSPSAHAIVGVFNLYHFVEQNHFGFGAEPFLDFTGGAGIGANARVTYGLTSLNNLQLTAGTGSGLRRLRFGPSFTFDFVPDIEGQPGIGLGTQAIYYRMHTKGTTDNYGQLDTTLVPYIHKNFVTKGGEFEPFVAVPFGLAFLETVYKPTTSVVVGSMFKGGEHVRYVMELGIGLLHTDTYISAGVIYYP